MKKQLTHKLIATAAALLTAGLFSTTTAQALVAIGPLNYEINKDGTATVNCYNTSLGKSVTIPNSIEWNGTVYPVTSIGEYAFSESYLTNVTIGDSVTEIKKMAFGACASLSSVTLGKGVTTIGLAAFQGCESLTKIDIPDSVTTIGEGAFLSCYTLAEIVIPDSVTTIESMAFDNCDLLAHVTLGNNVATIGSQAFYDCPSLSRITIPASVTEIGFGAFSACPLLLEIQVDENNSVYKDIDGVLFSKDESLLHTYPGGKTDSFYSIPDTVTVLEKFAFHVCEHITTISIPDTVSDIRSGSFYISPFLTSIQVDENNSVYKDIDGVLFSKDGSIIYNYPNGKTNTFYSIPDSVTSIDSWAFMHSCMLTNIVIGNSITEIENFSFSGCTSLTSITIGNSVTKIGGYAFERCYSLTDINIGNAVSVISYNAFEDCTSLAEIVIPNSVTFIANSAFKNCNSLRAVRFLNDTPPTTGEDGIFENCTADITIYHPIGAEANWGTYWQGYKTQPWGISESVILSNGSASIDPSSGLIIFKLVFTNNSQNISYTNIVSSSAGSLSIPSYIISEGAYYSVSSIGDNAFNNCTLLTEIIIPNTINSLGNNAFKNCSSLEWIRFQSYTPPVVGLDSFSGCPSDMLIYYPEGAEATWGTEWEGFTSLPYIEPIILNKVSESVDYQNNIVTFTLKFTNNQLNTIYTQVVSNNTGSLTIPSVISIEGKNYPVGSIGNEAFYYCRHLTAVSIPDSITSIGDLAFEGCDSLTEIVIPDSVTQLGGGAFYWCRSLTSVVIGNGVTALSTYSDPWISYGTFQECTSLTNIILGNSITSIGEKTFLQCYALSEIVIPPSVIEIGNEAFDWDSEFDYSQKRIFFQSQNPPNTGDNLLGKYPSTIVYYPAGAETNWGTEWQGCLTQPWLGSKTTVDSLIYTYSDNIAILIGYSNELSDSFSIPESITIENQTYSVVAIGTLAFDSYYSLKKIVIPNSVISIGSNAFKFCSSLTNITIGNGVTSIGDSAFYSCDSLTNITIPNSVTSIGENAFSYCSSLTNITIPDSVTSIGDSAFSNCDSLTEIQVDGNNVSYMNLEGILFSKDGTLLHTYPSGKTNTTYTIPSTVITIENYAFYNCDSLTNITIPDSVAEIGNYAFYSCNSLVDITIGNSVTSIGEEAFCYCNSLTNIVIPDSATSIGKNAFFNCSSLTNATLGNGLTTIGEYAFYGCKSLTEIIIPDSITSIQQYTFYNCTSVTNIVIPDSVISIGSDAFYSCDLLAEIIIPDSVTSIGSWAFASCDLLTEVIIPDSVTSIENSALAYCKSLTSVIIGNGVTSMGHSIFSGCSSLTEIIIPDSVTFIGNFAFEDCSSLTNITIGNGVTEIGTHAFDACTALTGIHVDENNPSYMDIDGVFFSKDGTLLHTYPSGKTDSSYTIPDSVTSIGYRAFSGCTSLTEIIIPDSVTEIAEYAFYNCSSLTEVIIPDSVTTIGEYAFSGCTSLTEIIIPDSVTSIEYNTFSRCSSLTTVIIGNGVNFIRSGVFNGCTSLTEIYFQSQTPPSASYNAFYNCPENMIIYYPEGAEANWGTEWEGFSTAPWEPVVAPITLTVTALDQSRLYGTENPELTYTITDENGIEFSVSGAPELSTTATLESSAGEYPITITQGTLDANYNYTFVNGTLTVIGLPETVIIDSLTFTLIEGTANYSLTACSTNCSGELIIPSSIEVQNQICPVTAIGDSAFSACNSLASVVIPDSITSIGNAAFSNCISLVSVTIGSGVSLIGDSAFQGCLSLDWIYFQSQTPPEITEQTFYECPEDIQIYYPKDAEDNWIIAWQGFDSASCVTLGSLNYALYKDGKAFLFNCDRNYSGDLIIPSSITVENQTYSVCSIRSGAFLNCTTLLNINISDSIVFIGDFVFYNCAALTNIVIPDSVTFIGNNAFHSCISLVNISISNSVKFIGDFAFYNCISLTTVNIPDSVTSIGNYVFYNCTSLINITIPNSVVFIGNFVFYNCSALTDIVIPDSVMEIGDCAFHSCTSLVNIRISNSITYIGNHVFYNCISLTRIIIPDSVTSIGNYVFYNCTSLINITIPNSVVFIGNFVFYNCSSLDSVILGSGIMSIGKGAFYNCSTLSGIYILSQTPPDVIDTSSTPTSDPDIFDGCPSDMHIYYPSGGENNWDTEWEGYPTEVWKKTIVLYVTAEDQLRPYRTENPVLTYTITDKDGVEFTVNGSPELSTTAVFESPIGEYPITTALGSLDNEYTYNFVDGILTINPAPATVTAKNISRPYNTENPELTYTISDASGAVITIPGMPSLATTATPESPVGEYPITAAQGTLDNNYTYTFVNGPLRRAPSVNIRLPQLKGLWTIITPIPL